MEATANKGKYIEWIDSLRGAAALCVVFHHLFWPDLLKVTAPYFDPSIYFNPGLFGVVVFFCISGYIIPFSIMRNNKTSALTFLISRVFRLYPVYWLSLLFVFLFLNADPVTVFINLTMAQRFLGFEDAVGVYWTLQVEIIFYGFMFILLVTKTINNKYAFPILSFIFTLVALLMAAGRYYLQAKYPLAPALGLSVMFLATTFYLHQRNGYLSRRALIQFSAGIYTLLCCAFIIGYSQDWGHNETPSRFIITYFLAGGLFVLVAQMNKSNSILFFFGKISYPMYLLHLPIFDLVSHASLGYFEGIIISLITIVLISTLLHYSLEMPLVRVGKQFVEKYSRWNSNRRKLQHQEAKREAGRDL